MVQKKLHVQNQQFNKVDTKKGGNQECALYNDFFIAYTTKQAAKNKTFNEVNAQKRSNNIQK